MNVAIVILLGVFFAGCTMVEHRRLRPRHADYVEKEQINKRAAEIHNKEKTKESCETYFDSRQDYLESLDSFNESAIGFWVFASLTAICVISLFLKFFVL